MNIILYSLAAAATAGLLGWLVYYIAYSRGYDAGHFNALLHHHTSPARFEDRQQGILQGVAMGLEMAAAAKKVQESEEIKNSNQSD